MPEHSRFDNGLPDCQDLIASSSAEVTNANGQFLNPAGADFNFGNTNSDLLNDSNRSYGSSDLFADTEDMEFDVNQYLTFSTDANTTESIANLDTQNFNHTQAANQGQLELIEFSKQAGGEISDTQSMETNHQQAGELIGGLSADISEEYSTNSLPGKRKHTQAEHDLPKKYAKLESSVDASEQENL